MLNPLGSDITLLYQVNHLSNPVDFKGEILFY